MSLQIGNCRNVTVMSLRSNKLEFLPDEIGQMTKLRVLNLSDNRWLHELLCSLNTCLQAEGHIRQLIYVPIAPLNHISKLGLMKRSL